MIPFTAFWWVFPDNYRKTIKPRTWAREISDLFSLNATTVLSRWGTRQMYSIRISAIGNSRRPVVFTKCKNPLQLDEPHSCSLTRHVAYYGHQRRCWTLALPVAVFLGRYTPGVLTTVWREAFSFIYWTVTSMISSNDMSQLSSPFPMNLSLRSCWGCQVHTWNYQLKR